ncbi:flagellar motor switch protein FliG [Erythrobacter aureus]|uniref:Flagellar motor switch protein FliG n=1 Tax=Erythrobacter aureus TaxID=2182384 RepID=A0A345YJP8_9SPHN|nr:flagellar motor switch protein FliG [Erythrobacter aureus]AXK44150.1 flagellar motor switch protein FliG [Erythrobacter aureus]
MNAITAVPEPQELSKYTGPQRAAALMLVLGPEHGAPIWEELSPDEIKELSSHISRLGRLSPEVVDYLLMQFTGEVTSMSSMHGSVASTERLLSSVMSADKVAEIMQDISGPTGRTMWDKLSNVNEATLAGYLRNEYPQTVAVILSKMKPEHTAKVIAELPEDFGIEVIQRMLIAEPVQSEIVLEIEKTLRTEFMANFSRDQKRDSHEVMADVFNALDRSKEESLLGALEEKNHTSAERIRALMFTFEDLSALLPTAIAAVVRKADNNQLALALKGVSDDVKAVFLAGMTQRAAKMLTEEMASMGPVRARECEDAQAELVRLAKTMADDGEILLIDPKSDETMIY